MRINNINLRYFAQRGAGMLSVCSDVQICIWSTWCHCHHLLRH